MRTESGISEGKADYKVPGGKLIRVRVRHRNGTIERVRFYGDFFIHPEEAIEELERRLTGKDLKGSREEIDAFFKKVESAGTGAEDFITALEMAIKG